MPYPVTPVDASGYYFTILTVVRYCSIAELAPLLDEDLCYSQVFFRFFFLFGFRMVSGFIRLPDVS